MQMQIKVWISFFNSSFNYICKTKQIQILHDKSMAQWRPLWPHRDQVQLHVSCTPDSTHLHKNGSACQLVFLPYTNTAYGSLKWYRGRTLGLIHQCFLIWDLLGAQGCKQFYQFLIRCRVSLRNFMKTPYISERGRLYFTSSARYGNRISLHFGPLVS